MKNLEDFIKIVVGTIDNNGVWYPNSQIRSNLNKTHTLCKGVNNIQIAFDYPSENIILNDIILVCEYDNDNFEFRFEFCEKNLLKRRFKYGVIHDGTNFYSFKLNYNSEHNYDNRIWQKWLSGKARTMISVILPKSTSLQLINKPKKLQYCMKPQFFEFDIDQYYDIETPPPQK